MTIDQWTPEMEETFFAEMKLYEQIKTWYLAVHESSTNDICFYLARRMNEVIEKDRNIIMRLSIKVEKRRKNILSLQRDLHNDRVYSHSLLQNHNTLVKNTDDKIKAQTQQIHDLEILNKTTADTLTEERDKAIDECCALILNPNNPIRFHTPANTAALMVEELKSIKSKGR